jgi:hypothetical protein
MANGEPFFGNPATALVATAGVNPSASEFAPSQPARPTSTPTEQFDPEEILEKLDFAVVTAREALDHAAMPGECQN